MIGVKLGSPDQGNLFPKRQAMDHLSEEWTLIIILLAPRKAPRGLAVSLALPRWLARPKYQKYYIIVIIYICSWCMHCVFPGINICIFICYTLIHSWLANISNLVCDTISQVLQFLLHGRWHLAEHLSRRWISIYVPKSNPKSTSSTSPIYPCKQTHYALLSYRIKSERASHFTPQALTSILLLRKLTLTNLLSSSCDVLLLAGANGPVQ